MTDVVVPGPMSLVAVATVAVPSASIRAREPTSRRLLWYEAVAIPMPISRSPSVRLRGVASRRDQPKRRAPVSKHSRSLRVENGSLRHLVPGGFVAQPQLDGIDAQIVRQLVHGRLQGEGAGDDARSAHRGR